jgi:hypothetical protein
MLFVGGSNAWSQCSGSSAAFTLQYDTVFNGNGNTIVSLSLPKFDPSVGTLLSVDITSSVGLQYSYILENPTATSKLFRTRIVRTDEITSTALDPYSVYAANQTPQYTVTLTPGQSLPVGPGFMRYNLANTVNDARMVNFMGAGTVDLAYETGTSASVTATLPWQLNFSSVIDTTHLRLTYNYCSTTLLASNLNVFTATPFKGKVVLNWKQTNPESGRIYKVQFSNDGRQYIDLASIEERSSGDYQYTWLNTQNSGKVFFRIAETNPDHSTYYSATRSLQLGAGESNIKIYPTICTNSTLNAELPYNADWQVLFIAADGRKFTEKLPLNMTNAKVNIASGMTNGLYTVELTNTKTSEKLITRILLRR